MRPGEAISTEVVAPQRWRFADSVFDEGDWTLTVAGRRVTVEAKPLELLRELLRRRGQIASKDQLLDAVWPDVSVADASLTTAMLKLRRALGDDDRGERIIETVPRIGYRFAVAAASEAATPSPVSPTASRSPQRPGSWRVAALAGAMALGLGGYAVTAAFRAPARSAFTQQDALDALNALDTPRIRALLAAGWRPDTPFDDQGNGALNTLLATCEWHPGHDQNRLMLVARLLIDHGASVDKRNVWGDTPYSIARAKRYCGPDHPVTKMIRGFCYSGLINAVADKCMASYELKRHLGGPDNRVTASR